MALQFVRGYTTMCSRGSMLSCCNACFRHARILSWSYFSTSHSSIRQSRSYFLTEFYSSGMSTIHFAKRVSRNPAVGLQNAKLFSSNRQQQTPQHRTTVIYIIAAAVFMVGMTYAGVPLYRMLCQTAGLGGEVQKGHDASKVETMQAVSDRQISVRFNADIASSMQWNFRPHLSEIKVVPGETALAFYKAKNPTDKPIVGISTYNVVPFEAAQYFNKIQCFCFEEQRLNPHEEVDLPVFFYIDPEFNDDPKLENIQTITLSYTFFEAKEGVKLPEFSYGQHQKRLL